MRTPPAREPPSLRHSSRGKQRPRHVGIPGSDERDSPTAQGKLLARMCLLRVSPRYRITVVRIAHDCALRSIKEDDIEITDIAFACGSGGTAAGIGLGSYLRAQAHEDSALQFGDKVPGTGRRSSSLSKRFLVLNQPVGVARTLGSHYSPRVHCVRQRRVLLQAH